MKRTLIGLAVLAVALSAPAGVAAGRGESVDPALMQPPLNESFGPWECWRTGTGITCEGHRTLTAEGVETGIVCDGRPVYTNEVDVRTQRRYGDENGLALKTIQHVDIRGVLGFEPDLSGPNLAGRGIFQETFVVRGPRRPVDADRPLHRAGRQAHWPRGRSGRSRRGRQDVRHRRQRALHARSASRRGGLRERLRGRLPRPGGHGSLGDRAEAR